MATEFATTARKVMVSVNLVITASGFTLVWECGQETAAGSVVLAERRLVVVASVYLLRSTR